jgi:hypothetical protein
VAEMYEALGPDADKDPDAFVDNDGNPLKFKKKITTMCENIYVQKKYRPDEIPKYQNGKEKYYIDINIEKKFVQDAETNKEKCYICPRGKECPHAHNPIQLDLIPLKNNIKNLSGIVKSQTIKLKNAKPLEPWRPSAASFSPAGK